MRAVWLRRIVFLAMALAAVWLALPKPPLIDEIDFSTRVRDRNGNVLRVTLTRGPEIPDLDAAP